VDFDLNLSHKIMLYLILAAIISYLLIGTIWHGYVKGVNRYLDTLGSTERNAHWLWCADIAPITVLFWPIFLLYRGVPLFFTYTKLHLLWEVPFNAIVRIGEQMATPKPKWTMENGRTRIAPPDPEIIQRQQELQEAEAEVERCLTEDKYSKL
jgi:hypothetical protein